MRGCHATRYIAQNLGHFDLPRGSSWNYPCPVSFTSCVIFLLVYVKLTFEYIPILVRDLI